MKLIGHVLLFMFGGCAGIGLAGFLAWSQLHDLKRLIAFKDEEINRLRDRLRIVLGMAHPGETARTEIREENISQGETQ